MFWLIRLITDTWWWTPLWQLDHGYINIHLVDLCLNNGCETKETHVLIWPFEDPLARSRVRSFSKMEDWIPLVVQGNEYNLGLCFINSILLSHRRQSLMHAASVSETTRCHHFIPFVFLRASVGYLISDGTHRAGCPSLLTKSMNRHTVGLFIFPW